MEIDNSSVWRFHRKPKIYKLIRFDVLKNILTHISKGGVFLFFILHIVASVGKHSRGEIPAPRPPGGDEAIEPLSSVQNYIHRSKSWSEMLECHNEDRFLISMNYNDNKFYTKQRSVICKYQDYRRGWCQEILPLKHPVARSQ